jgi:hypothetical protein
MSIYLILKIGLMEEYKMKEYLILEKLEKDEIEGSEVGVDKFSIVEFVKKEGDEIFCKFGEYTYALSTEDEGILIELEEKDTNFRVNDKVIIISNKPSLGLSKGDLLSFKADRGGVFIFENLQTLKTIEIEKSRFRGDFFRVIARKFDIYSFPQLVPENIEEINGNIFLERFVKNDELYMKIIVGDDIRKLLQVGCIKSTLKEDVYNGVRINVGERYLIKNLVANKDALKILFIKELIDTGNVEFIIPDGSFFNAIKGNISSGLNTLLGSIINSKERIEVKYDIKVKKNVV